MRRNLCYAERRSKGAAKASISPGRSPRLAATTGFRSRTHSVPLRIQGATLIAFADCRVMRAPVFTTASSSQSSCAEGWFKGVATLQLRSFDVFDDPQKAFDAWVLELAQPSHSLHAPTVCSAPVTRVPQSGGHGRISSVTMVLQWRRPLPWLLVHASAPWQTRRTRA